MKCETKDTLILFGKLIVFYTVVLAFVYTVIN